MSEIKKILWRWDWGVYVPFCPYCDEPAYYRDYCFDCGKPYIWVDGKYKPKEVYKGEYTAVQSTNKHIAIYKGDHLVMHSQCNEEKTEEELLRMIDRYIEFRYSGQIEDLLNDESEVDE